jgi:hypothetical protein
VWLVDAATSEPAVLLEDHVNTVSAVRFTPEGDAVEVFRNGRWTFALDGTPGPRTTPPCEANGDTAYVLGRSYKGVSCGLLSPDTRWMLYERTVEPGISSDMWLLDVDTGKRTRVQERLVDCGGCDGRFGPEWSPSGRYVTYAETGGEGRVFLTDVEALTTEILRPGANEIGARPAWAPEADHLAVVATTGTTIIDLVRGVRRHVSLLWPARWDPSGTYLYSPAWASTETETTIVEAATGEFVARLPGRAPAEQLWTDAVNVVGLPPGGYTAALEAAPGCDGTQVTSTLRAEAAPSLCVADGVGAAISPDGQRVAVAIQIATRPGPFELTSGFVGEMAQYAIVLVDVESGDRVTVGGEVFSFATNTLGHASPPAITWNRSGSHFVVLWPAWFGI